MTKLNKALMASTAIAFASGLAFPASAQDPAAAPGVVASQKKVKVTLYGQVARVFGFVGDGETTTFKQGENGNTSTRMGIDGRGKVTNDINVRTRFEFQATSGNAGGGTQFENQGGTSSGTAFAIRHLDVILSSKKFGAVWIGRGDTASNGTSEVQTIGAIDSGRLGGTTASLINAYQVLDKNESQATRARGSVSSFFDNFDGLNRQNRIRYDTPTFFGFKLGTSLADKMGYDVALWYDGKIGGTKLEGAVGFCHARGSQGAGSGTCFGNSAGTIEAQTGINGSVSFLTPIGLGATFSGGYIRRALADPAGAANGHASINATGYNIQPAIFYTMKATEVGATTLEYAFQYCDHCSTSFKNSEGIGHSLMLMQQVDSIGGDYFLTFRYFDVDTGVAGDDIEGLWFAGGGFRQRF